VSIDDTLGSFILDSSALADLGGGENIYATTWADRAAVHWDRATRPRGRAVRGMAADPAPRPGHVEQMRDLLASPMVLIDALDETEAARAGELVGGRGLDPDVTAAQVGCSQDALGVGHW
jgi:hypothetical protein